MNSELSLSRKLVHGVQLHASTEGPATLDYEVVTGVQHKNEQLPPFQYFQSLQTYECEEEIEPCRISVPPKMAKRILEFCAAAYVEGRAGFSCFSFVAYVLGVQSSIEACKGTYLHSGSPISPAEDTRPNKPYIIYAPETRRPGDNPTAHGMLGSERPGYSLNVIGPEMPLAFARNSDIVRLYGAQAIVQVDHLEITPDR